MKSIWLSTLIGILSIALLTGPAFALTAEGWFDKGNRHSRQGQWEEAVKAYEKSIENNPSATVAHINLGLSYKKLKDYDKAKQSFKKAVELEPYNMEARFNLGNVYNFLEQWENAIAQLNIVVHRNKDDAQAHGNLGWAYFNYRKGTPFKLLTVLNLQRAVSLFEEQNMTLAAESTRTILKQAMEKYKPETIE